MRSLPLFVAFVTTACVVPPPPGTPVPPRVEILKDDARAGQYGTRAADILNHPEMREKVRRLFGTDWGPDAKDWRALSAPAPAFFSRSLVTRVLRIEGSVHIAALGCMPEVCLTHRGLLLIRAGGDQLLARLDEGGVTRYYAWGTEMMGGRQDREIVDAAWREIERASRSTGTPEPKFAWRDKARECYEDLRRGALVVYEGRFRGRYLIGRAACDQYLEDMESLEAGRRPTEALQPLESVQLETEFRPPTIR